MPSTDYPPSNNIPTPAVYRPPGLPSNNFQSMTSLSTISPQKKYPPTASLHNKKSPVSVKNSRQYRIRILRISQYLIPMTHCRIFQCSISKFPISHRREKGGDMLPSTVVPDYPSTNDCNAACILAIKEDNEDMDILQDEDKLAYEKTRT